MNTKFEINQLRPIKVGIGLIELNKNLRKDSWLNKAPKQKRSVFTKIQREQILEKTDAHCNICGIKLDLKGIHANFVKHHTIGVNTKKRIIYTFEGRVTNYVQTFLPREFKLS